MYVGKPNSVVERAVKELKGFKKVYLKAGESKEVEFTLTRDDLAFYTADMTREAEPGEFEIWIGGSSATENSTRVRLK